MPRFFYVVRDTKGKRITGIEEGNSQEEIINRLQAKELIVIAVAPEVEETSPGQKTKLLPRFKFKTQHWRITGEDLTLFCRQLATLLGAGVTIMKSLEIISLQVSSRRLYNTIKDLEKNMESGLSLHEAMAKHPRIFSELWINLVESGEASGNLAIILNRLANYLERNAAFKRKIISALIYPTILMIASIGALLFLTIKIIPTFAELFKGFNVNLPTLTKILVSISFFIRRAILLIFILIIFGLWVLRKYIQTRQGRRVYEKFKLGLPIFGGFFRAVAVERFSSEMSTLVESGVPILYSLEITERSVGNLILADIIHNIKEDVRQGRPLSQPLERSGFFEPMVVQMITVGEEIGELSQMFKKINAFYQEYIETYLTRFTSMFEPLMLIFMGVVVGIMVVGMFLPIFQIARIAG
ncbi:MAG: type II secretion system F family protein [Candidatus Omnitrophica bacterium]|nr:type II secretion system F family protein [Candidatus Omnitrophota bacterium]